MKMQLRSVYLAWPMILACLITLFLLYMCVHRADAATLTGTITHATKYEDGQDLGTNFKHSRVEVGTCTSTGAFSTKEGEALVTLPATTWTVTVLRQFGDFCARSNTEVQSGLVSTWTGSIKVTKVEPKPLPPLITVAVAVYEILPHPIEGTRLGRNVGTVPLGTACGSEPVVQVFGGTYYEVPMTEPTVLSKNPKSTVVVALCAEA